MPDLKAIPTNIITGFLGVGKTTAILNLLEQKPDGERWAILVNEFGEVGIDGSVFTGTESEEGGIFIREVPGGCMCCTAGLPMQIALNMLLARARPHRLLIEPTGLGHPVEVLGTLSAEHYRSVLDLRATVTLVDARKVRDSRYTGHDTFNQQLEIGDIIVANKADLYQPQDFPALLGYLDKAMVLADREVFQVTRGALQLQWLAAPATRRRDDHHHHDDPPMPAPLPATPALPDSGYLSVDNEGEGFYSRGWIFDPGWIFDSRKLYHLLLGLDVERVKGVFITDRGIAAYNKADEVLTETGLDDALDSRIECISADRTALETLEAALLDCVALR